MTHEQAHKFWLEQIGQELCVNPITYDERVDAINIAIDCIEKQLPKTMHMFKDKCSCGCQCFPHMTYCHNCGQKLEWVNNN